MRKYIVSSLLLFVGGAQSHGEGFDEVVDSGKWYRIAESAPDGGLMRTNALFSLRDDSFGYGHSNLVFRVGMSYNDAANMSVSVESHSYWGTPSFSELRVVSNLSPYNKQYYLEVKIHPGMGGVDSVSAVSDITDNLGGGKWVAVDWLEVADGEHPSSARTSLYGLDTAFMVGGDTSRLSVSHSGDVKVEGSLELNGDPVLTIPTANNLFISTGLEGSSASGADWAVEFGETEAKSSHSFTFGRYSEGKREDGSSVDTTANVWNPDDPIFEIGVGSASEPENAITTYKNGKTVIKSLEVEEGLEVKGGLLIIPQEGDLLMGSFQ